MCLTWLICLCFTYSNTVSSKPYFQYCLLVPLYILIPGSYINVEETDFNIVRFKLVHKSQQDMEQMCNLSNIPSSVHCI